MHRINENEIREGDLIREERREDGSCSFLAIEYRASHRGDVISNASTHYLLERPKPAFEPHWGMTIADPADSGNMAVCTGVSDDAIDGKFIDWLTPNGWEAKSWAEQKLAEGWVVVENPEETHE